MPRLEPSDIGTGRLCRNVASRTRGDRLAASGSGTGFRPGREFGEQLASARRRCALVAAMAEETGRAGRRGRRSGFLAARRQTNCSWAGWRAMAMAPTAIMPGGYAALRV